MSIKSEIQAYEDAIFAINESSGLAVDSNEELAKLVSDARDVLSGKKPQLLRYYLEWLASDNITADGLEEQDANSDKLKEIAHRILCIPDNIPSREDCVAAVTEAFDHAVAVDKHVDRFQLIFGCIDAPDVDEKLKMYKEEQRASFVNFLWRYVVALEYGNRSLAYDMYPFIARHYGWA